MEPRQPMDPHHRKQFNDNFTDEAYTALKADADRRSDCAISFRIAETPLFLPRALADRASRAAEKILIAAASPELQSVGACAVPNDFRFANETDRPLFGAVDFAITGSRTAPELKLIELQGFPSLYFYQAEFTESVKSCFGLDDTLGGFLQAGQTASEYYTLLSNAILGGMDPKEVVLLELDPFSQKTLPDFLLTQKRLGIAIVNIRDVIARGTQLFYRASSGLEQRIKRIYNRAIHDELVLKQVALPFDVSVNYDVEWAGHPNWYYKISKVLLPKLFGVDTSVPFAQLLSEANWNSLDLEQFVLKPLYSFAGAGVIVGPTATDIENIPLDQRSGWLLQERVTYGDMITTPEGAEVKVELRVMLLWPNANDGPISLYTLVRLSRGKMMGVNFNKGLNWTGSSSAIIV
jgi:hypothetical protein